MGNSKIDLYFEEYMKRAKSHLPAEQLFGKLKLPKDEKIIKEQMGLQSEYILDTPKFLFHGSPESFEYLKARESTQRGKHVYATDNPIKAMFFAIFRNSSEIRGHIREKINSETGEYSVRYIIDERVPGEIEKVISDTIVTVHVCSGDDFYKGKTLNN